MTTKEKLIDMCVSRGMFETDAVKVVESAVSEIDSFGDYRTTWDRPAEEYPPTLYAVMFLTVQEHAIKYIDEHYPRAWFREVFVAGAPA